MLLGIDWGAKARCSAERRKLCVIQGEVHIERKDHDKHSFSVSLKLLSGAR